VLVIGVGNPDRGDDAVGWRVVDQLTGSCEVARSSGDPAGLIEAWRGHDRVLVVDATRSGLDPGTVWTADLLAEPLPAGALASSHGLGPVEAVELARALGDLPGELILVGIEGSAWEHGTPLSKEVRAGAEEAVALIRDRLDDQGPPA
jgi:hydrogenase maturation protease